MDDCVQLLYLSQDEKSIPLAMRQGEELKEIKIFIFTHLYMTHEDIVVLILSTDFLEICTQLFYLLKFKSEGKWNNYNICCYSS